MQTNSSAAFAIILTSLGGSSPDAFYISCAFGPLEDIIRACAGLSQRHLDLGLKAAHVRDRADVARYLLSQGARADPLVAMIGEQAARSFLERELRAQDKHSTSLKTDRPPPSEREANELRLQWVSLRPSSKTAQVAVEGFENAEPTVLHLQALSTTMTTEQRLAWMSFDLKQHETAHINRIANIGNVSGSPLNWAVDDHGSPWENRAIVSFLLERGADPLLRDRAGQTPRAFVEEQLALSDECLMPKMRAFYLWAKEELLQAEQAHQTASGRCAVV